MEGSISRVSFQQISVGPFCSIWAPLWFHFVSMWGPCGPFGLQESIENEIKIRSIFSSVLALLWLAFLLHFGSIFAPLWLHSESISKPNFQLISNEFWPHFGSILGPIWSSILPHFGSPGSSWEGDPKMVRNDLEMA